MRRNTYKVLCTTVWFSLPTNFTQSFSLYDFFIIENIFRDIESTFNIRRNFCHDNIQWGPTRGMCLSILLSLFYYYHYHHMYSWYWHKFLYINFHSYHGHISLLLHIIGPVPRHNYILYTLVILMTNFARLRFYFWPICKSIWQLDWHNCQKISTN